MYGNIIAELTTAGATVREYIYLPEAEISPTRQSRTQVDLPLAVVDAVNTATPVLLMVHDDHLGRPVRMTNSAKASVWDVTYTPWGAPHALTGAQTLNTRFPGQWFQLESGLHYNWHRHYDPSLGRYTQPDPHGFVDGPSVYAYAGNSPTEVIDFLGLVGGGLGGGGSGLPPGVRIRPPFNLPPPPVPGPGQTIQPEPLQKPIPRPTCISDYFRCLNKCDQARICKYKPVAFACAVGCSTIFAICAANPGNE